MTVDNDLRALVGLEPSALRCPFPHYDRIREAGPVCWSEEQQHFVVTGHDEILAILRDPVNFSNASAGASPKAGAELARTARAVPESAELLELRARNRQRAQMTPVLASTDPPEHDRHRALVNRVFTPRTVAAMEPRIAERADRLIDGFIDAGSAEFVGQFAMPLASGVLGDVLGIGPDALPMLEGAARDFSRMQGNSDLTTDDFVAVLRARLDLTDFLDGALQERRADPRDDLLTRLATAEVDGDRLRPDEQLGIAVQLWGAGVMTASRLIATGIAIFARDVELQVACLTDEDRLQAVLEEVLRLEGPVQGLYRTATAPAQVGGVDIPEGSCLWIVYAAGNRDERVFPNAAEMDLDRPNPLAHMAFGHGIHHCIGASLARAEARIGWGRVLARMTTLEESEPAAYERSFILHGPATLPMSFRAR